jgi:hypothetical protein
MDVAASGLSDEVLASPGCREPWAKADGTSTTAFQKATELRADMFDSLEGP